ncbi:ABC transporter substrate-binding protein, partial [Vibrio cholerae O1]|nr:ABC transporter substrate-binding protein [Vibrio cholerae O1]
NSIAGSMAKLLKLKNIASSAIPDDPNAETATLSVEKITQQQPDIIMVTSMVQNNALARQIVNRELTSNPAWQAVDAVRKK